MSIKPFVVLEQWQYHEEPDPQWRRTNVLSGVAFGHPRLGDDTHITTSQIVGVRDGRYVETENTVYRLGRWSGRGLSYTQLIERLGEVPA